MAKKTIIIDGAKFSDIESFYNHIDDILTKDLDWQTGHNLDAFNDLLRGGFGVHEYAEPIKIVWKNSNKSRQELDEVIRGKTIFEVLIDIIRDHDHIEFVEQ